MAAAVALAGAVDRVAGVPAMLKWPNDLVVGDRKLAGLLAERDGDALVVGAGCNVNWERFPDDLAAIGHLVQPRGRSSRRPRRAARRLPRRLRRRPRPGGGVVDEYRARLATLGRRVRVEPVRGDPLLGTAVDVTDDGALVVRDDAGTDHAVATADVVHLR